MQKKTDFLNMKKTVLIILIMVIGISTVSCSNMGIVSEDSFPDYVVGSWKGQLDVADLLYRELGEELDTDFAPEPEYCDIEVTFSDDGTYILEFDPESMASAMGNCVEPYLSALIGFDTDLLVELVMRAAVKDIPEDSYRLDGRYVLDNEDFTITLVDDDSEDDDIMCLDNDGNLQYGGEELGQTVIFQKNAESY